MDIYLSWIASVKEDIVIQPITFISLKDRIRQKNLVKHFRLKGINIYVLFPYFSSTQIFIFLLFSSLKNNGLVLHVRKRRGFIFKLLKLILKRKLRLIVEYEGDPDSELSYLKTNANTKTEMKISNDLVASLEEYANSIRGDLSYADEIIVKTSLMKSVWSSKYDFKKPIHVLPDLTSKNIFYFDVQYRNYARKLLDLENKKVLIFCGGLRYGWQNLEQSIKIFIKLKVICDNLFFLILTPKHDVFIAKQLFENYQVNKKHYRLESVSHDHVNLYLNASDIAIALREDHMLNKMVTTGKMGEYLAAGLPVISSRHIGFYSDVLGSKKHAFLFDDIYEDAEIEELINRWPFFVDNVARAEISNWFCSHYVVESCCEQYKKILKNTE